MKKIRLIIEREYLTRVKKKSFLLTTILVPVIIIGFYAAIIAIAVSGGNETETVAVVDKAGLFDGKIENGGGLNFSLIENETEESFKEIFKQSPLKRSKFAGIKRNLHFIKTSNSFLG